MKADTHLYWTAFYTRSRCEKKAAELLMKEGYFIYAPLKTSVHQWSDRKVKVKEPIFPSYIFAKVDEAKRKSILENRYVIGSVLWLGKPVLINDDEIEAIRSFLESYLEPEVIPLSLKKGRSVIITDGPLKNNKAIIEEVKNNRVKLVLLNLGFELIAEIKTQDVKEI